MKEIDLVAFSEIVNEINSPRTQEALVILAEKVNKLVLLMTSHSERLKELEERVSDLDEQEIINEEDADEEGTAG